MQHVRSIREMPLTDYQEFRPPAAILADAPPVPLELASRGTRLGAKCVDWLVCAGLVLGCTLPGLVVPFLVRWPDRSAALLLAAPFAIGGAFLGLVALAVWNCVWLARYGQTVGKRALRIRIVRSSGEPATLGRIFLLRFLPTFLMGSLPYVGLVPFLVDSLLIFRDSQQCLHDQIADTLVVKAG